MPFRPDLKSFGLFDSSDRCLAVGFLGPSHDYPRGPITSELAAKLARLAADAWAPYIECGLHECAFCKTSPARDNGYLIIPSPPDVFAAPRMICHYLTDHGYLPPSEFQTAVEECPPMKSPAYFALLAQTPFRQYLR